MAEWILLPKYVSPGIGPSSTSSYEKGANILLKKIRQDYKNEERGTRFFPMRTPMTVPTALDSSMTI